MFKFCRALKLFKKVGLKSGHREHVLKQKKHECTKSKKVIGLFLPTLFSNNLQPIWAILRLQTTELERISV